MKTIELRRIDQPIEVRMREGASPMIAGYAAVFNAEAVIGGMFREVIKPGAFRNVIADAKLDVRGTFDHEAIIGRTTNGTLRLREDERGLTYEIDINPADAEAMSVLAKVQRGDVTGSSFGFIVKEGGDEWVRAKRSGELPLRTISEYEVLRDVGPVAFPAFDDTTAEVRSAARAAASTMTPEAAEEAAEVIQYQALKDMLDQLTALIAKAAPMVDALIADETNEPTETVEAEAAEEEIESARFNVLRALGSQMCGAASGFQSLAYNLGGYGYYSADATIARARADVDLLALEA